MGILRVLGGRGRRGVACLISPGVEERVGVRDVLYYYVQNIHRHIPELCERRSRDGRLRKQRRSKKTETNAG